MARRPDSSWISGTIRRRVEERAAGKSVLNVFAYSGGFSLYAARGGAHTVVSLDSSEPALHAAEEIFALNSDVARDSRGQDMKFWSPMPSSQWKEMAPESDASSTWSSLIRRRLPSRRQRSTGRHAGLRTTGSTGLGAGSPSWYAGHCILFKPHPG